LLDQYDRGARLSFARNPEYFAEGDLPYMDGVEYYIIPEAVTRFASFRSGDLDMLGPAATDVAAIESEMDDVTLLSTAGTAYYATTIATFKEPWNDERTWRAVALAISKQDANQVISAGRGFVGDPLTGSKWALTEEELLQVPGYKGLGDGAESDMETRWTEARALFDAAGVAEGTEVAVHGRDVFEPWATVFADGLTNAGLVPTLSLYERGQYDELLAAKDYGDMSANSRGSGFADPTPVYADSYLESSGRHYTGLVLPEVEDLFRRQDAALDPEERMDLANQMQKAYLTAYPAEIAAFTETRYALRDYVKDYGNLYGSIHVSRKLQWMWLDK
jgi:peptide/nickel transport system substrate-binding protein